VDWKWE